MKQVDFGVVIMARNGGKPLANSQHEMESLSPRHIQEVNAFNNLKSLKVNLFPVKFSKDRGAGATQLVK